MGAAHTSNCILSPLEYPMMNKLKRTCRQHMNRTRTKTQATKSTTTTRHTAKVCLKAKKHGLIEAMPRCSSFGSAASVLTPTKKPVNDPAYSLWKRTFEDKCRSKALPPIHSRIHDISEALSGQLTPQGFPAFTNAIQIHNVDVRKHMANETFRVRRRLSLRLPMLRSGNCVAPDVAAVTEAAVAVAVKHENNHNLKSASNDKPYYLSKLSKEQAIVIQKLYQEIKDLEDYYGMRLDYYYF